MADGMLNDIYLEHPSEILLDTEISHDLLIDSGSRTTLGSHLLETESEPGNRLPALSKRLSTPKPTLHGGLNSEIHSKMLRAEDPTIERDLNHIEHPFPCSAIVLQKPGNQNRMEIKSLLNSAASLEETPSFIDTNTQRVNFARELSEGQYSMAVPQISTRLSASLAHSTVRTKSSEKMNQDAVQTAPHPTQTPESSSLETMQRDSTVQTDYNGSSQKLERTDCTATPPPTEHWTTQTLGGEENPAELPATPESSPEKKVAMGMSGKHTDECDADEDPFRTHSDSIFPSTCELLDGVDWTGTSMSPDLTKAVPKQPRKLVNDPLCLHPDAVTRTTQDVLDRPESLAPTASKNSPKTRRRWNCLVDHPECLTLTDEQCKRIQKIVDPNDIRNHKDWETKSQTELIRLYMAGKSFPQIASEMDSKLFWS
jgi:hypothetical protein